MRILLFILTLFLSSCTTFYDARKSTFIVVKVEQQVQSYGQYCYYNVVESSASDRYATEVFIIIDECGLYKTGDIIHFCK